MDPFAERLLRNHLRYEGVTSPVRKEIEALIRSRLESKCVSGYSWSTAAAADEASFAVFDWLNSKGLL